MEETERETDRKKKRERENGERRKGKESTERERRRVKMSCTVFSVFNSVVKSSNSQFPKVHVKQPYRPQGLQALRCRGPVQVILSRAVLGGDRERQTETKGREKKGERTEGTEREGKRRRVDDESESCTDEALK